jgi:hypothetical protein
LLENKVKNVLKTWQMYATGMNCATLIYKSVQVAGAPAFGAHIAEKRGVLIPSLGAGYGFTRNASTITIISKNITSST